VPVSVATSSLMLHSRTHKQPQVTIRCRQLVSAACGVQRQAKKERQV